MAHISMSDCHQTTTSNAKGNTGLETETSMTTTGTPCPALRALLAHPFTDRTTATTITTTTTPSFSTGISLPTLPSSPPNQNTRIPSEILPRLFISDIFTAVNGPALRTFHITHIISITEHAVAFPSLSQPCAESKSRVSPGFLAELDLRSHSPPEPIPLSLKTLHVPITDSPAEHIYSYFPTTKDFIVAALKDEHARVLVHCYLGQSRSPTIVAAYLIYALKLSTRDALRIIQTKRPRVLPNRGFRRQLEQWEVIVREEEKIVCSDK